MEIIACGCSFTYGEELLDRSKAWPGELSRQIGCVVHNLGAPGVGNDYIVKKAIANSQPNKTLAVIAWTSCERIEFADQFGAFTGWPGSQLKLIKSNHNNMGNSHRQRFLDLITEHHNTNWAFRRWLRQVVLLQSFFQAQQIPYLMVNAFNNQVLGRDLIKHSGDLVKWINTENFAGWPDSGIVEWIYGTAHMPKGHPSEAGHVLIAQMIHNELKKRNLI